MGNCSTRDHRDELYMRPAAPLVKGGTPSHHHQAPKRSGLKQIVLTAWTFDNFDLDLEGGDWRYAFSSSRAIKNGAWILVIRLLAAIAMLAYYHLELLEYMAFGLKFKAYAHFATWTDTVVLLYLLAALAVHYRALRLAGTPEPRAPAKTPWFISVTWALYAIALPMALTAFVLELLPEKGGLGLTVFSASFEDYREIPALLMLLSLFINNYTYHTFHAIWPMIFALSYLIFTYAYFQKGGVDENGVPFVFYNLNWAYQLKYLNGAVVILAATLLNFKFWYINSVIRSVNNKDAWRRIDTSHAMLSLKDRATHDQLGL